MEALVFVLHFYLFSCFCCGILAVEIKIHRPGRHICSSERVVMTPIRRMETYCRPYYQRHYLPCPNDRNQLCTHFRLTYRTAQRTMFHMIPQRQQSYSCCPGWSNYSSRYHRCLNPVCDKPCENGGFCNQPGKCSCTNGWDGRCCENDKNECIGNHRCQHLCNNTRGGYNCSCYEGFTLQDDLKSCQLCLSCTNEYIVMETENTRLRSKVQAIESEMDILNRSVISVTNKLIKLSKSHIYHGTTMHPHNTYKTDAVLSPEVEDMLIKLSEQFDKLEHRVGQCYCESEINKAQNEVYKEFKTLEKKIDTRLSALEFEQVEPRPLFNPLSLKPKRHTEDIVETTTVKSPFNNNCLYPPCSKVVYKTPKNE